MIRWIHSAFLPFGRFAFLSSSSSFQSHKHLDHNNKHNNNSNRKKMEGRLNAACKSGKRERVEAVLKEMLERGMTLDNHKLSTYLFSACRSGNADVARLLIQHGADANFIFKGQTPLIASSQKSAVDVVDVLLELGADPNLMPPGGKPPLSIACHNGRIDTVQRLLDHGADPNLQNREGITPLMAASHGAEKGIVLRLVSHGADFRIANVNGATALSIACQKGNNEIVEALIECGDSPNGSPDSLQSPLMAAVTKGMKETARILLDHGADINAALEDGTTPLIRACEKSNHELAMMLVERGANINASNETSTALSLIATQRVLRVVEFFLDHGADPFRFAKDKLALALGSVSQEIVDFFMRRDDFQPNRRVGDNNNNNTLFMSFAVSESSSFFPALLTEETDVNAQNQLGETALILAAKSGCRRYIHLLLQHGADANIQDQNGKTALFHLLARPPAFEYLPQYTIAETTRAFLDHGADPNARFNGETLLHLLSSRTRDQYELYSALLERGADPNALSDSGDSVLFLACKYREPNIVQLLLAHGANVNMKLSGGRSVLVESVNRFMCSAQLTRLLIANRIDVNGPDGREAMIAVTWDRDSTLPSLLSSVRKVPPEWKHYNHLIQLLLMGDLFHAIRVIPDSPFVHSTMPDGTTPLMLASEIEGASHVMALLFRRDVDINARRADGKTALLVALEKGKQYNASQLIEKNPDVNIQDNSGKTALMLAARLGIEHLVRNLLKCGADRGLRDAENQTAFDLCTNDSIRHLLSDQIPDLG